MEKMKIKLILPLNETKFGVWQISPMEAHWYFGPIYSAVMLAIIFFYIFVSLCVTPWNFANYKSMFKYIYHVIWLYDWLGWVEVWCELAMCDFVDFGKLCVYNFLILINIVLLFKKKYTILVFEKYELVGTWYDPFQRIK